MAKKSEPEGWAQECIDSVEMEVPDAIRATLTDLLKGVMQERPLRSGEVITLVTTLLETQKASKAEENAA